MSKYILSCSIVLLLFTACKKEEENISSLSPECLGVNMVGMWSVVDSIEITFLDVDSIGHSVSHKGMILHENGIGNLDLPSLDEDHFFRWNLQCEPDIFTMSTPINNNDSVFNSFQFGFVKPYEILVNELDYKKMLLVTTDSFGFEQKRVRIRTLTKN